MRKPIIRGFGAAAAAGAALAVAASGAAAEPGQGPQAAAAPAVIAPGAGSPAAGLPSAATAAAPGQQARVSRDSNGGADRAAAVAVSPDGTMVVVTGSSYSPATGDDYATVAYSTVTGAQLWAARYNGPGNGRDNATAVTVSPTGRVFVTGRSYGGSSRGDDYATVAYRGATGVRVWVARYNGPASRTDSPTAIAVRPDDSNVFVTGSSDGTTSGSDYATVAYRTTTGARVWAARYNGPGNGADHARAVTVSPTGRVFVTGSSYGGPGRLADYATAAYRGATGVRVWVARYNGPASRTDTATAAAVRPDDSDVFVTGSSYSPATRDDYATVAYSTVTGARVWAARYNGPGNGRDNAAAVTVSPTGRVFVTGRSYGGSSRGDDYATVAYRGASGAVVWSARYNGPASLADSATAAAVSPDDTAVFITGASAGSTTGDDYATVAYRTTTGSREWASRYDGPAGAQGPAADAASAVIASRNAALVFVTGTSTGDYATVAYRIPDSAAVFRGLGAWVDTYDYAALNPVAVTADLKAHGVRTLYLGTGRYDSPAAIADPAGVAAWLTAAHAAGLTVVGWYVPSYSDVARDVSRTLAISSYTGPDGQRFDGIGIDIEYPLTVPSASAWNQAVASQLAQVRAGTSLPIAAIVLPPLLMQTWPDPARWATFPWAAISADANAVAPMDYWTSYTPAQRCAAGDPQYCAYQYTRASVLLSRQLTGLPVHVIGGAGTAATVSQVSDFLRAARETAAAGGSFYDYRTTAGEFWPYLEQLAP
jgi:WD40 repeat protein